MTKLEELITEINRFEAIIAEWDESQRCVAVGLKTAIEALHKAALTSLIKTFKQENISALRQAVSDEVVYAVLLYHELVKPPLAERLQIALAEVRPSLKSHNGDVELVAIKPPDTVEVRLIGSCSNCSASTLTLSHGVEQAIKKHCPEIKKVIAVNNSSTTTNTIHTTTFISPFPLPTESYWLKVANLDQIPPSGLFTVEVANKSLILSRQDATIVCYLNACSHLGQPLSKGKVENSILTCPSHGFQYQLTTGQCLTVPNVYLQSYEVRIKEDKVFVKVPNQNPS
ncbi:MAG TPA: NifU family protein [Nostocaceae cyanobacterium]|nr:NifU family protein [Nostocaceae cyanobacterium]